MCSSHVIPCDKSEIFINAKKLVPVTINAPNIGNWSDTDLECLVKNGIRRLRYYQCLMFLLLYIYVVFITLHIFVIMDQQP